MNLKEAKLVYNLPVLGEEGPIHVVENAGKVQH